MASGRIYFCPKCVGCACPLCGKVALVLLNVFPLFYGLHAVFEFVMSSGCPFAFWLYWLEMVDFVYQS
jgi:hypothetical protein